MRSPIGIEPGWGVKGSVVTKSPARLHRVGIDLAEDDVLAVEMRGGRFMPLTEIPTKCWVSRTFERGAAGRAGLLLLKYGRINTFNMI